MYGKQPIRKFMNRNILKVEKTLSLEEVSYRLTTSLDLYTEEFILLDNCLLAGKGRLIDLLHEITKLQVKRARYANPLTQLPGNVPIQEEIQKYFVQQQFFIICYFDLDNFKPFNDIHGFKKGDEAIMLVADLLTTFIDKQNNFIGHIGGDDFVVIFREHSWKECVHTILEHFDKRVQEFYKTSTENEDVVATDRWGNQVVSNHMGLSVGAVLIDKPGENKSIDIPKEAAIAKHHAKRQSGSFLYIHRPCE